MVIQMQCHQRIHTHLEHHPEERQDPHSHHRLHQALVMIIIIILRVCCTKVSRSKTFFSSVVCVPISYRVLCVICSFVLLCFVALLYLSLWLIFHLTCTTCIVYLICLVVYRLVYHVNGDCCFPLHMMTDWFYVFYYNYSLSINWHDR